jgi:hypothetical protein
VVSSWIASAWGSIEQIRVEKSFYSECAIGAVLRMVRRLPSS